MSPDVSPLIPGERRGAGSRRATDPPSAAGVRLEIPPAIREELGSLAERQYPEESCGFLLGRTGPTVRSVHKILRTVNRAPGDRTTQFSLEPEAARAAQEAAERSGLCVVGFFHSHPDRPAVPSGRDELQAWLGYDYLITAVQKGRAQETRAYRLDTATFRFRETAVGNPPAAVHPGGAEAANG